MIQVKFFASVREQLGCAALELPSPSPGLTVAEVLQQVELQQGVALAGAHLLAARNQEHVPFTATVADGDELAFFPPVTGG